MSRNGDTVQSLGGEDRIFRFDIGAHRRLEERFGGQFGVSLIVQNLHPYVMGLKEGYSLQDIITVRLLGDLRLDQVREVLFQGLVGGGMPPAEAGKLCKAWVEDRPLIEAVPIAYAVGLAALVGAPEDDPASGEPKGASGAPPSQTGASGSAKTGSTPSAQPAASRPRRSKR